MQLDITANLASFRKANVFQAGVISFIANLQTSCEDLQDLNAMFLKLDKNNDGLLSTEELKEGMSDILGAFASEVTDWPSII